MKQKHKPALTQQSSFKKFKKLVKKSMENGDSSILLLSLGTPLPNIVVENRTGNSLVVDFSEWDKNKQITIL
jgi:hypothetical protein